MKSHLPPRCLVYWEALHSGETGKRELKSVAAGGKKGKRWQGNGSSLSRRLCLSTERHWWVSEDSLEQTNVVGLYVSHKRRSSSNNTSMEMTRRRCNPGLPVRLDPSRSRLHVARFKSDKITNSGSASTAVRLCLIVLRYTMCALSLYRSPSSNPLLTSRVDRGKTCCSGSCNAVRIGSDLIMSGWLIISTKHANICCSHQLFTDVQEGIATITKEAASVSLMANFNITFGIESCLFCSPV